MTDLTPFRTLRPWTRHSLVLMVAGVVYAAVGFTYLGFGSNESRQSTMRLQLMVVHDNLWIWGVVFILVGLAAIISSRWPPASETWGYTSMTGLSCAWSGFYLFGIFLGAPAQGFSGVLLWGLVAFLWWAISGLVNPISQKEKVVFVTLDTRTGEVDAQTTILDKHHRDAYPLQ